MKSLILSAILISSPAFAANFCVCEARVTLPSPESKPGFGSYQWRGREQETMCFGLARNWALRSCVAKNMVRRCAIVSCELR